MMEDEQAIGAKPQHEIGTDLADLSVHELEERIALLGAEISRLQEAITAKQSSLSAADAAFKI